MVDHTDKVILISKMTGGSMSSRILRPCLIRKTLAVRTNLKAFDWPLLKKPDDHFPAERVNGKPVSTI